MKVTKKSKKVIKKRVFDKFIGILDKNFETEDKRYNAIVGCDTLTTPNERQKGAVRVSHPTKAIKI